MVYRETDLMPDEKRVQTEYYKSIYEVNNWHYSLQLVLAYDKRFLGVITFYKNKGKEDFKYADIFTKTIWLTGSIKNRKLLPRTKIKFLLRKRWNSLD